MDLKPDHAGRRFEWQDSPVTEMLIECDQDTPFIAHTDQNVLVISTALARFGASQDIMAQQAQGFGQF
jgi:hypothetical protein